MEQPSPSIFPGSPEKLDPASTLPRTSSSPGCNTPEKPEAVENSSEPRKGIESHADEHNHAPGYQQKLEHSNKHAHNPEHGHLGTHHNGTPLGFSNHRSASPAQSGDTFNLVSVTFKEAALDSPSFRATVNHLDTQLAQTEDWFVALVDSFMKVPQKIEEFSSVFAILDYLVPSFLQDSLVDQEYCLVTLHQTRKTLRALWSMAFSVFKINVSNIEKHKVEFATCVTTYRRLKQAFLACQEKYDRYYHIHMSTPKFKDAGLLFEDSLQLASVRREYLSLSLELVSETQKLTSSINQTILSLNELFWMIRIERVGDGLLDPAQVEEFSGSVQRIRAWHGACQQASAKLSGELALAQKNIEENTIRLHAPAVSINDYRPELMNSRVLGNIDESAVEKHGYLCMKTYSEKSSKPVWVKRWTFLKNGVLGFLVLSPSLESVQETDKIGVLLCNAKYTPNEDRHFCFEVKTIDTTIVLQAETLHELKSWLKVFENIQTRIIDETDPMHPLLEVATSRYAPLVAEFSAATNTSVDRDITSKRTFTASGVAVSSKRLVKHLERNEAFFHRYVLDAIGRINLPVFTAATKSALVASSLAGVNPVFPTALEANLLGSANWGSASGIAFDSFPSFGASPPFSPSSSSPYNKLRALEPSQTKQIGNKGISYPKPFPNIWIARDLQMRALFGASVDPQEYCLVAYNCLLSPNEKQELRATHFITQDNLYSYIHSLGFVSMSKIPLNRFVDATCFPSKNIDTLRLTLVHGELKLKLFLESGILIERKINFLLQNLASDFPVGTVDIITELLSIENKFEEEKKAAAGKPTDSAIPTYFEFLNPSSRPQASYLKSIEFDHPYPLMVKKTVNLPPKAVFHVLCGSESEILDTLNSMVEVQFSERSIWKKSPNKNVCLVRDNVSIFQMPTGQKSSFKVNQEVEVIAENEFYSIKITKSLLKVTCGPSVQFVMRLTIQKMEAERSAIRIYGEAKVNGTPVYNFLAKKLCDSFVHGTARLVLKEIDVAADIIGSRGKILKAVYFYGKILVAQEPYESFSMDPVPVGRFALCRMALQLVAAEAVRLLVTWCFLVINAMKLVLRHVTVHAGLLFIIVLLTLSNIYLTGLSTHQYWAARKSGNLVKELVNIEPFKIKRAVYLKDIQDLVSDKLPLSTDSACFHVFKNQSIVLNHHQFSDWAEVFKNAPVPSKRQQLRDRLNDIATKRNELLVSLKMLNHLEEEEARAEWKSWLAQELATCNQISNSGVLKSGEKGDEFHASMKLLGDYCDSCAQELAGASGII
ncbi:hypothetical protein JCM33374_g2674 [Metschnikowia sp. JCM 33374]|nr:hypothetical protein JCM33374_g2674 [Metschnikowia sp. JCM 33374]